MENLTIALLALLSISCAGRFDYDLTPAPVARPATGVRETPPRGAPVQRLNGTMQALDGATLDLASVDQPLVLVFAQDTCVVCRAETRELKATPTTRVRVVTLLVGATMADARDWADELGVSWSVGIQPGDALFASQCEQGKVPCTVVQMPERGIVWSHTGRVTVEELKVWTGEW